MLDTPFEPWPSYDAEEAAAVSRVLLSNRVNYWTGPEGRAFEAAFAEATGCSHAIALANGTVAIDLALIGLGIGAGDDVIVTPRSYFASVSSVVNRGARPVFADVDRDSQNITVETIRAVLTGKTRAILCVHLAGWPCDMPAIRALADPLGIHVIEDCAQAHGASIEGRPVGSWGHVAAWSFCQDKIMTTGGEGGMVTTDDPLLWRRMWEYKDHGKSWDAVFERHHPPGFRWLHESFGTNWRMTEMQSVIGRIQLGRLASWHELCSRNAQALRDALSSYPAARIPWPEPRYEHGWYKFYGFVDAQRLRPGWTRDRIVEQVQSRGVPCLHGSCPEIYREKAFEHTPYVPAHRLPVARELGESSFMMLVHPSLSAASIAKSGEVLRAVFDEASA